MDKFLKHSLMFILIVCVMFFIGAVDTTTGSEKGSNQSPIASVGATANRIEWHPQVECSGMILTVSGPKEAQFRREFKLGDVPYFEMLDNNGTKFPDGACTYQLQLIPLPSRKVKDDELPAGRKSGQMPVAKDIEESGQSSGQTMVQAGSFLIEGGHIVTEESSIEIETSSENIISPSPNNPDYVIYDDLIVTGSECLGFDCANGESFGFDTLILKEHNLRVYFNDTSYTASYSSNDWRITINDSVNGGASYFSIDDVTGGKSPFKVEAGAPNNSLYVEDYGRVGLGTSTPVVELHIKDSDTPTMRLEQDSSGGWTAQTWDLAGNESNFFVRDATNGSKLPFRIQPNTPTSTLCLKSTGMVGVGTWSPKAKLHVQSTENATDPLLLVERLVDGDETTFFTVKDSGDVELFKTLGQGSDRNQKKNIEPVDTAGILKRISELPLSKWSYNSDDDSIVHMGPMAQDFYASFGLGKDDKHITPIDSSGVALAAIQELYKLVAKQNEMIRELQERNTRLEARLKDG
jgi:hypothetical protein